MALELDPQVPVGVGWKPKPTLGGRYYFSSEVWEAEKERIFTRDWFCIAREEEVPNPGDFVVREVAGESLVLTRAEGGVLRAFFNTCRHRGTRLCDDEGHLKSNVIKCPYHAWTYDTDGNLLGTPNVHEEEGFDKTEYSLWKAALETWQGFVWVNLSENPASFREAFEDNPLGTPWEFERYGMDELRIGKRLVYEVEANWKILLENFNECLHCPSVHPELVRMVPLYRKGRVDEREGWWGNSLVEGATTLTPTGHSNRPPLPGIDEEDLHTYYGFFVHPNMLLNFHSDCVMAYRLEPSGPSHTTIVSEYLFHPNAIAAPDFNPNDIGEFWDLVSKQDWAVCERAQVGVRSKGYAEGGVYPWNDHLLFEFNEYYLARIGDA